MQMQALSSHVHLNPNVFIPVALKQSFSLTNIPFVTGSNIYILEWAGPWT